MSDKPKTLHGQLMELAEQIEREKYRWNWTDYPDEADKYSVWAEDLRHIATRVKGFEGADTDAPSR